MSDTYKTLRFELDEHGVAYITINRPDKLNALNGTLLDELGQVINKIKEDDSTRGVIITGSGEKAFVAGADIRELRGLDEQSGREKSLKGQQVFQSVEEIRKPVIALVNGYALGGGAELALACHMRVATRKAVFGFPEVSLGLIPGYGGTQRLPGIVGRAKALELILTGNHISAEEAHRLGLVNMLVPETEGMGSAQNLMNEILENGPLAVSGALQAVYQSGAAGGFQSEAELFGYLCSTEDAEEGTTAFLEKRSPEFQGK
ncbi:enoyl-CoA hydratase/isomerase family protein [Halalkalibaculum sp. DA3122]|uniref:enoyl-CoA hydratase/isomerase family protein n=1 Tax=unclassified Halalkalibaculum TaxID=2964617 RepID=UPI0037550FC4